MDAKYLIDVSLFHKKIKNILMFFFKKEDLLLLSAKLFEYNDLRIKIYFFEKKIQQFFKEIIHSELFQKKIKIRLIQLKKKNIFPFGKIKILKKKKVVYSIIKQGSLI